jgi:hypothetical protein
MMSGSSISIARFLVTAALVALAIAGGAPPAGAGMFQPSNFASLGAFPSGSGVYFVDTTYGTLTTADGRTVVGVRYHEGGW